MNSQDESHQIEQEVEKTLQSLDHWERVSASPFFSTQLQKRWEENSFSAPPSFWNSSMLRVAVVTLLLLISIAHWAFFSDTPESTPIETRDTQLQVVSEVYFGGNDMLSELTK